MMLLTVNDIISLLQCHILGPLPLVKKEYHHISGFGLATQEKDGWHVTEKGEAYIKMLIATPMPEQTWGDPRMKGE